MCKKSVVFNGATGSELDEASGRGLWTSPWTCEPIPAKSPSLRIKAKGVALLIVFDFIQRYAPPLTGVIAGENEGVNMHVIRAVLWGGFM